MSAGYFKADAGENRRSLDQHEGGREVSRPKHGLYALSDEQTNVVVAFCDEDAESVEYECADGLYDIRRGRGVHLPPGKTMGIPTPLAQVKRAGYDWLAGVVTNASPSLRRSARAHQPSVRLRPLTDHTAGVVHAPRETPALPAPPVSSGSPSTTTA